MAFPPDQQRVPHRRLSDLGWQRLMRSSPLDRRSAGRVGWWRRRSRGSALVQALMAALIALIGALLLASRLFSSRFNSFSRSDTLAAREAAEFGLNELQSQLNTNQRSYLWVTKRSSWSSNNLLSALNTCNVQALDSSGNQLTSLPALPAGITAPRTIRSVNGATISYQLRPTNGFQPPELPDQDATTVKQEGSCGIGSANASAAANFGNLSGGSAIITVVGTVARGSGDSATSTNFTLSRRVHVLSPAQELKFSFIILGNAYSATCTDGKTTLSKCTPDPTPISPSSFGAISDVSRLNVLDGNICYGTPSDCSTPLELTVIGCADLDSCIVNNVDTVSGKTRNGFCTQKVKKTKTKSIICNGFQQAGAMPPVFSLNDGAPNSVGFIGYNDNNPTAFSNKSWSSFAADMECDSKANDQQCKNYKGDKGKKARFPYIIEGTSITAVPANLAAAKALKNSDLAYGCYFNNTNGSKDATGASSTAINCLANKLSIADSTKSSANLIVYTRASATGPQLLPVNLFVDTTRIELKDGGIQNVDTGLDNWFTLRIIGHNQAARNSSDITQPIVCDQQRITSKNNEDINGAWIWLPNGWLEYDKTDSKDTSYNVIWACKFTAPVKGSTGYKIITPKNLDPIIRSNLIRNLPGFTASTGGTYRAYGSDDSPTP